MYSNYLKIKIQMQKYQSYRLCEGGISFKVCSESIKVIIKNWNGIYSIDIIFSLSI